MVITGIVYALLLSGVDVDVTYGWVNDVLHRIIPLVILVDWIDPGARQADSRT
ncbi:hypothetical protein BPODLACK_01364 [Gordonia sp. YY1]|nr:hypothetical protein BPODLACK_01364 [Gordonia sp. YY1]